MFEVDSNTVGAVVAERNTDFTFDITCDEILGVYQVEINHNDEGAEQYIISEKPSGSLLVYRGDGGKLFSLYIEKTEEKTVETSCLVDLL